MITGRMMLWINDHYMQHHHSNQNRRDEMTKLESIKMQDDDLKDYIQRFTKYIGDMNPTPDDAFLRRTLRKENKGAPTGGGIHGGGNAILRGIHLC